MTQRSRQHPEWEGADGFCVCVVVRFVCWNERYAINCSPSSRERSSFESALNFFLKDCSRSRKVTALLTGFSELSNTILELSISSVKSKFNSSGYSRRDSYYPMQLSSCLAAFLSKGEQSTRLKKWIHREGVIHTTCRHVAYMIKLLRLPSWR